MVEVMTFSPCFPCFRDVLYTSQSTSNTLLHFLLAMLLAHVLVSLLPIFSLTRHAAIVSFFAALAYFQLQRAFLRDANTRGSAFTTAFVVACKVLVYFGCEVL